MPMAGRKLSALEQSPRLRTLYTQLCFCYAASDYDQAQVEVRLHQGLRSLTNAIPWLAGQVIVKDGELEIVPLRDLPDLTVKDLTLDPSVPTMRHLKEAKFPFYMLDEKTICPRNTLSDGSREHGGQPYPVLLLQANFIQGGMLLTILACHSTMDIVGQALIIRLLSQGCHGLPFNDEVLMNCNQNREDLVPLLDTNEEIPCGHGASPSSPVADTTHTPPSSTSTLTWAYFMFDASTLTELKKIVTSTLPESTAFVSTDDCICALLWQSLARVRLIRLDPATALRFLRQVDVRKYMSIADTYPGMMVSSVTSTKSLTELASGTLGAIASSLRALLDPKELVHDVRAAATEVMKPDGQKQRVGGSDKRREREDTLTMSSWSKADCHNVDFNLGLGMPVAVRRPKFTPIEGVVYLLPKGPDRQVFAGICLREDDMVGLRNDEEFGRWTEYIG